jgi:uncharacterized protein (DUF2249 family)
MAGRVSTMLADNDTGTHATLTDEHSVLLWQTCAYADDLVDNRHSDDLLSTSLETTLRFLHYRLLPYLRAEEQQLADDELADALLTRQLVSEHDGIRAAVDTIETSRTRRTLSIATRSLIERLDRHVQREDACVMESVGILRSAAAYREDHDWALPLMLSDHVDLAALPSGNRDTLVLERLQQMRPGDVLRLHAEQDMHPLWCRQHIRDPGRHAWVYEQDGPHEWTVRVTRREPDSD